MHFEFNYVKKWTAKCILAQSRFICKSYTNRLYHRDSLHSNSKDCQEQGNSKLFYSSIILQKYQPSYLHCFIDSQNWLQRNEDTLKIEDSNDKVESQSQTEQQKDSNVEVYTQENISWQQNKDQADEAQELRGNQLAIQISIF